jgi:hypothetical protein
MRGFKLRFAIALLAMALPSCGPADKPVYHGELYFGRGSYLMRFNLHDGSLAVVDNLGDKTIREISSLGPDRLLIAETTPVNCRDVSRISWIDLKSGEVPAATS